MLAVVIVLIRRARYVPYKPEPRLLDKVQRRKRGVVQPGCMVRMVWYVWEAGKSGMTEIPIHGMWRGSSGGYRYLSGGLEAGNTGDNNTERAPWHTLCSSPINNSLICAYMPSLQIRD